MDMAALFGKQSAIIYTIIILSLSLRLFFSNDSLRAPPVPPCKLSNYIKWTVSRDYTAGWSTPTQLHSNHNIQYPLNYALIRSGDVHVNPGPRMSNTTPADFSLFPKKGLNFLHVNTRSLIPKLSNLKVIAQQTNAAVIAITETMLDSSVTDNEIGIDNYNVLRCDRNRNGGGACLYIRSDLAFNLRNDLMSEGDNEVVWCDLLLPKSKPILLGVIYRSQIFTDVITRLDKIFNTLPLEQETYILGDFNICTLEESVHNSSTTRSYLNRLSGAGFENVIKEPTRVTETTESCIDHILCNNLDKVFQCGVMPTGFSDHFLVYCTRKSVRVPLNSQNIIRIRSMKQYSVESFRNMLSNCDWSTVLNCECVNTAWINFKIILTNVLDQIAPERDVRIKIRTEP
ncbi:uncharacterized protein [Amphiura filiformis]|uniref:uncharacterized protein n=1 Tax=Amphiura filiformis TaxID=82378 RepID=UPI003B20E3EE